MWYSDSRIYLRSLELVSLCSRAVGQLPPGYAYLGDQLRRAVSSVPLNFAEGCGRQSIRDRRRFFLMARGSAYEVAAALDVGQRLGVVPAALAEQGHDCCDHIAAMLSRYR